MFAMQGVIITCLTMAAYFIGHFMEAGVWEAVNSADGTTMAFPYTLYGRDIPFILICVQEAPYSVCLTETNISGAQW